MRDDSWSEWTVYSDEPEPTEQELGCLDWDDPAASFRNHRPFVGTAPTMPSTSKPVWQRLWIFKSSARGSSSAIWL
jgi:hypothetical protein